MKKILSALLVLVMVLLVLQAMMKILDYFCSIFFFNRFT